MDSMILQIPMERSFKLSAQRMAEDVGFSSLQDLVRFLLTQFTEKKFAVTVSQSVPDEILTAEQEKILTKEYLRAKKEIDAGKGFTASSAEEMMAQLRSNKLRTA
jgi:hypothetical protein